MDGGNLNVSVLLGVREVKLPGEAAVMHRWANWWVGEMPQGCPAPRQVADTYFNVFLAQQVGGRLRAGVPQPGQDL